MKEIKSIKELKIQLKKNNNTFLLLYKSGSEQSDCAFNNLKDVYTDNGEFNILFTDVTKVRDIHPNYNIKTVPSLLEFKGEELNNISKGCINSQQLKNFMAHQSVESSSEANTIVQKNVVVYSTPTCSWCTTLKNYLKNHHIRFRDVDVSVNQQLAMEMVKKSGQQGVPQTEINGQMIVGFDRNRINQLLEINN